MPPACRPETAAAAALVVGTAAAFALRAVVRTVVPAAANDPAAALIGPRVRAWYRGVLAPVEDALVAWRIQPDTLTWAQLAVSLLAGAAFWVGAGFLAGWLTIVAGTLDILDGGLARRGGVAGPRGAFMDSLIDRYAEFATFVGLGAFFGSGWPLLAVAVAAFASLMVSYTRARAEGLGLEMRLGNAQRPERYVILGFGAWISDLVAHLACGLGGRPTQVVLAAAVVMLALLSSWTALARARHAARALSGQVEREPPGVGRVVNEPPGVGGVVLEPPGVGGVVIEPPGVGGVVLDPPGAREALSMGPRAWRPVGFLLLMFGFGLRLDTAWQGLAWVALAAGAAGMAAAAWPRSEIAAFVPRRSGR